ncbi:MULTISPECIES: hypothetical protein [unclassified Bradyrhizobium]|uniref:hypothetical protein n=1 Tax=unclassified Bradyrhizobium TaxID=2631580 RepID=UPI001FF72861|nr:MULTISPECIES: hypothetical protein [unclassified Bradyrhizobium]MCK1711281.1 hypothetical protein [Bradyrhizobium sp. 143]MCK1731503.1 hypothetical protein [Bradyrhizobium sp. 142]
MTRLKLVSAAALTALILPLATTSPTLAAGRGPGWCTPPGNMAVGAAGPAMNGGQLMAGVGQCRPIANRYGSSGPSYGAYGYYSEPGLGVPAYAPDYEY